MYHTASPAQKASISAHITQLNQDVDVAMIALDDARRALKSCRDRWAELAEIRSAVEGVSEVTPLLNPLGLQRGELDQAGPPRARR